MKGSFKTALIAAVVAAAVSAGAAVATTQTFVLGAANTPDAPSSVVAQNVDDLGGMSAPMIKLTNSSTGSSATPLALKAGVGQPPLTVNTKAKVANLNADWLDGLDSSSFLPKTGTATNSNALGGHGPSYFLPASGKAADSDKLDGLDSTAFARGTIRSARAVISVGTGVKLFSIPSLVDVNGVCESDRVLVNITNTSGVTIDWYEPGYSGTMYPGENANFVSLEGTETLQFGRTEFLGLLAVPHVSTITFGLHKGSPCRVEAQAVQQP
jgi:hypothetical protein